LVWIIFNNTHACNNNSIYILSGVESMMLQFAQSTSINSSSSQPEEPVKEADPILDKIKMECKNILLEYEQLKNLDVCI
jgi:hypothetical protein